MSETKTEPVNRIEDNGQQEPEKLTVEMTKPEWAAILQLVSVGVRHSDDSALELGGRLLTQMKTQLS